MLKSLRYGKEFEELYTGNYSRLYYYAYQFLNDAEVSRDVVNDAFEYVWKNYENFRKMNVVAILFQSVRNKSIDTFRHNKVEENYVALYSRMLSEEDAGLDEENEKIERIYKVLDSLKETFRPEFLNRIDEIVSFKALTKTELLQIVDLMLQNTNKALQDKDIIMNISDSAKNFLLEKGTDLKYGARPLRRAIQRYVEDELSDLILKSDLKNGQTVNIDCINNELSFVVE